METGARQVAECRVDRDEAMRYLGYSGQELGSEVATRVEAGLARCDEVGRPAWCCREFPVEVRGEVAVLVGAALELPIGSTLAWLVRARSVVALCCTIGAAFDQEARWLAVVDAAEALVFDAAGSSLVEECADECERVIGARAVADGLFTGQRTSPGYGDFSLEFSGEIVKVLDATRLLGVSVLESGLLVPQKSVTAIVGLFEDEDDARAARRSCADCAVRADCEYLKAGRPCNG